MTVLICFYCVIAYEGFVIFGIFQSFMLEPFIYEYSFNAILFHKKFCDFNLCQSFHKQPAVFKEKCMFLTDCFYISIPQRLSFKLIYNSDFFIKGELLLVSNQTETM